MPIESREVRLAHRPQGEPLVEDVTFGKVQVPDPRPGEVLVRNLYISVDPYMRGRMNEGRSYVAPFELGKAMEGGAVGRVLQSREASVPEGSLVLSNYGWREAFVAQANQVQVIDAQGAPVSAFLGTLGMPGMTAWVGLFRIANLRDGEALFVSAASGAVGVVACQLARMHGCRVIGSAGTPEKVAFLRNELKMDYAFDYHEGEPVEHLRRAAPEGIDVYFDNTQGPQLEAALDALRLHGRVAMCGGIAGYNRPVRGPRNLMMAIGKRLRLEGFIVTDFYGDFPAFYAEVIPALTSGKLRNIETIVEGLDQAPAALLSLLRPGSKHVGKLVVHVGD